MNCIVLQLLEKQDYGRLYQLLSEAHSFTLVYDKRDFSLKIPVLPAMTSSLTSSSPLVYKGNV